MTEKEIQKPQEWDSRDGLAMLFFVFVLLAWFLWDKVGAMYLFGIFLMLLPIKKWYIAVISGLILWVGTYFLATNVYKVPVLNITSPLENNSKEYKFTGEVENFSEIFVNNEKIEVSGKNFEKNIVLEKLENTIKIHIKNGFLRDSEKEIIVKRNKTEEEIRIETEQAEQKAREEAEKTQKEQEKKEQEKAELPQKKFEKENHFSARYVCQQWVKTILKSPKTADFSDVKAWWVGDGIGMVTGVVTAKNAFGVDISNKYKCKFTWQADKEDFSYTYEIVQ